MDREDRTVCMSVRDSLRAGVCGQLIDGTLSERGAADRLALSVRQVRRLKRRVGTEGPRGVIHRSRGRASPTRLADALRAEVTRLYREVYTGWNMQHFGEWLAREHDLTVSRESLRRLLLDDDARPRRADRSGRATPASTVSTRLRTGSLGWIGHFHFASPISPLKRPARSQSGPAGAPQSTAKRSFL